MDALDWLARTVGWIALVAAGVGLLAVVVCASVVLCAARMAAAMDAEEREAWGLARRPRRTGTARGEQERAGDGKGPELDVEA